MTTETSPDAGAESTPAAGPLIIRPDVVAAYEAMAQSIPLAGADGYESILLQIIQADDPAALDAPWRADGLKAFIGHPLEVRGLRRMESEFAGGLPFFLIVDAVDLETGEVVTVTTGAVSIVAQLAKAFSLGAVPGWRVIPREADRPSSSVFYPQHLEAMRGRLGREG